MTRVTLAAAAFAAALPATAIAQQVCGPRAQITAALQIHYGEETKGGGLQNGQAVYEVWASEDERTWTILMSRADGTSCIMASGTDWRDARVQDTPIGAPS
ncbi:MAG: hypothetical protein ACU0BS_01390 [Hasllibacter sp.]